VVRNYQLLKKRSFPWNYLACEEHSASHLQGRIC
jgi:hypothetical protein